jgi:hypothetical protein
MSAARYSGTGAQAASANSARSPAANACRNFIGSREMAGRLRILKCSDGPPLAQPFGRAPYVVNPTKVVLFRGGGKIFAGNGAGPVPPGADKELAIAEAGRQLNPQYVASGPLTESRSAAELIKRLDVKRPGIRARGNDRNTAPEYCGLMGVAQAPLQSATAEKAVPLPSDRELASRARQLRAQLSAPVERRAEPRIAGHPT